ncbi:MAG TPA: DinB family protein [Polyangiaceae bacterium]|nr:DinB family protein [Polyangiaceae bacterium]
MDAPFSGTREELFAEYNRWMNEKLYACAARLSDEQRKQDLGAFFKSIHGTLNHLLWGDLVWLARFRGETPTLPAVGTILHDGFDELAKARVAADVELTQFARSLTPERLARPFTFRSMVYQREFSLPTWVLVTQMWNHQTHHRGQVTTLLMQLGIDPGPTDVPLTPGLLV